jgi:hypothetical protein
MLLPAGYHLATHNNPEWTILRLAVYSRPICVGAKPLEACDPLSKSKLSWCHVSIRNPRPDFFTAKQLRYCLCGAPSLTRGQVWSVNYNCCWPSPEQSFLVPSPTGLMAIFYCPRLETRPIWRARSPYFYIPLEKSGPLVYPGTGFSFRRLLRLEGLRWKYSNPPLCECWSSLHIPESVRT